MLKQSNLISSQIQFAQSNTAIIVLPEIFGITNFILQTIDKLVINVGCPTFGLDIFAPLVGSNQVVNYSNIQSALELKNKLDPQQFLDMLSVNLNLIQEKYPQIKHFSVIGFCFGGRLAYLSGLDKRVNKIISCYGSGMNAPYYKGMSAIESLGLVRKNDHYLSILSIFGSQDFSIVEDDRNKIINSLHLAEINYQEIIAAAPHAFLNFERSEVFNLQAANQIWPEIYSFLKAD